MCRLVFSASVRYTGLFLMQLVLEGLITKLGEYVGKKVTLTAI